MKGKLDVPAHLNTRIKTSYPNGNIPIFEEFFNDTYDVVLGRILLPINFTSYYVNNKYGNDKRALQRMQKFIDSLDGSLKYTVVLQYDDGILNDISRFDIKVFGSGGGRIDFPIPLICHPHGKQENSRDIFCNFVGSLTHQVRRDMITKIPKNGLGRVKYYISTDYHEITAFCNILSRSIFTMCPRGYGASSFRICEALEQGSIPIYISDRFIKPFNNDMMEYAVLIDAEHIDDIDLILRSLSSEQIKSMQEAGQYYYQKYFTFEGCRKHIIENI